MAIKVEHCWQNTEEKGNVTGKYQRKHGLKVNNIDIFNFTAEFFPKSHNKCSEVPCLYVLGAGSEDLDQDKKKVSFALY